MRWRDAVWEVWVVLVWVVRVVRVVRVVLVRAMWVVVVAETRHGPVSILSSCLSCLPMKGH